MTAPDLPDIPMPFGVVHTPVSGNNVLEPAYVRIPEGVSTIQVTWDQPQHLRITTAAIMSHSSRETLEYLPAGTGRRMLVIPGVGVSAGQSLYLSLLSDGVPLSSARATVQIITLPTA